MRIIVIGGGAAGLGAAGAAKGAAPDAEVVVFTEYEDVAYSPCGIPFVHGKEIDSFDRLFLATKEQYVNTGIDVRYETSVTALDPKARTVTVDERAEPYDRLVIAAGWNYAPIGVPGADLDGIYEVKNIRRAMEWDKRLDSHKSAVVIEAGPVAMEMVSALVHRNIAVTVVDPAPWPMADVIDPDIVEPIRQAWQDDGVDMQWGNRVTALHGDNGALSRVETEKGAFDADLAIVGTHKVANNSLAEQAGLKIGATGGLIVDSRMTTSDPNIFAAGDCTEIPHGVTNIPLQGLSGSHAYSQGKTAGTNAGGGNRHYEPVFVPWGMLAGEWMIGGVSFGETLATALGMRFVVGKAQGITRARYYPGVRPITVKLLAEPGTGKLVGAQMIGGEGIKERADFLAMAVRCGIGVSELATMENVYSPAIGALNEPIAIAAQNLLANQNAK